MGNRMLVVVFWILGVCFWFLFPHGVRGQTYEGGLSFDNVEVSCDTAIVLPEPTGHHQVGVMEFHWIDHDRDEWLSMDPHDDRQVMASVFYPGLRAWDRPAAPYVPELDLLRQGLRSDSREFPQRLGDSMGLRGCVKTSAFPDVPGSGMDRPFPIVLFSPGGNMSRHWHTAMAQELASHGYVVAVLTHAHSGLDVIPRGGFTMSAPEFDGRLAAAPAVYEDNLELRLGDLLGGDASFALDRLVDLHHEEIGPLSGVLDIGRVAILGHSRGGTTVGRACSTDSRFSACVVYDNIGPSPETEVGLHQPQLSIRSPWPPSRTARLHSYLRKNRSVSYDVVLAGAVHHSFDDLPFVDPTYEEGELPIDRAHRITADLTLAFLHRHLRGREDTVHKVAGRYQEASVHPFRHGSGGDEVRSREKEGGTLGGNRGSTRAHPGIPRTRALADSLGTDSFLLLMGGEERARFGDVTREYRLHSVRKSLLGTLFGVALARGDADTARTLADLRMDDDPSLSPAEKTATVRHLLQSRSGIFLPATHENPAWDRVRPRRGSHPPGAYWHYSNWGFNAAGAAYQIMTGESLFRAFERDIARPIGMTDFSREDGAWRYGVRSRHPAYVFRMSTRDLARFGQLMLQGGWWNGQAVVPEAWVHEITRPHSRARLPDGTPMEDTGYGMTWWVPLAEERHGVAIGQGAFVASGTGTQLLLVAPAMELVFVHRNDTDGPSEEYRSIPASDAYRLLSILLSELTGAEQLREPRRAPGERLFR